MAWNTRRSEVMYTRST